MIDGFTFYRTYIAIKLHFTSSYDAVKYHGKTRATRFEFDSRNDRLMYEALGRKCQNVTHALHICVSNQYKKDDWFHSLDYENVISIYNDWKATKDALTSKIREDLEFVQSIIFDNLTTYVDILQKTKSGNKAPLLQLFLTNKILPETIIFLDGNDGNFINNWVKEYSNDPLVSNRLFKLTKYNSFVKLNHGKLLPIYTSIFLGDIQSGKN